MTIDEVYDAYYDCCKHKGSTPGCIEYQMNYIANNYQLYIVLKSMSYEISKSKAFCVTRPKLREVFCADFRDHIIHHLLAIKFTDILESEMTDKAYACRKGKGTDYGIADVKKEIERVSDNYTKEAWVLKCDLQGFFMSINRSLLYSLLEKVIRKKYHGSDIEWWLWLLLMSAFDKWVLSRIGKSGGYGRYVDDFVVISRDKKLLLNILQESRNYLLEELGLTLHPRKVSLQRASSGVRFTGALIRPGRMLPNIRTIEHLYDVIDKFGMMSDPKGEVLQRYVNRINSLMGALVHYNTYNIRRKAWTMMPYKDRVFCVNMKKIRIMNKYKT